MGGGLLTRRQEGDIKAEWGTQIFKLKVTNSFLAREYKHCLICDLQAQVRDSFKLQLSIFKEVPPVGRINHILSLILSYTINGNF